ncbi:nuclear transport factor 2 family protein [Pseudonocardia sp. CA-107938]|uniref:nuclear transport factor 2 family protein n=1 Tax=Pseudonocardia sp. CA-107938 TaxID=3240021 RepID=UPI003D8E25CE
MSSTSPPSVVDANKAIVRELFEAWSQSRFDRVRELVDPDGEWWNLASRRSRSCRAQIDRFAALNSETTTGGIEFRVGTLTAEEDRVAVVVESHAEFAVQGDYDNIYHFLFQLDGGRVVRAWNYYDTDLANRVLRGQGVETPPLPSHAND